MLPSRSVFIKNPGAWHGQDGVEPQEAIRAGRGAMHGHVAGLNGIQLLENLRAMEEGVSSGHPCEALHSGGWD